MCFEVLPKLDVARFELYATAHVFLFKFKCSKFNRLQLDLVSELTFISIRSLCAELISEYKPLLFGCAHDDRGGN